MSDEAPRRTLERALRTRFETDDRPATARDIADIYVTLGVTHDLLSAFVLLDLKTNPGLVHTPEMKEIQSLLSEHVRSIAGHVVKLAGEDPTKLSSDDDDQ